MGDPSHTSNENRQPQLLGDLESPFGHLLGFLEVSRLQERKVSQFGKDTGILLIARRDSCWIISNDQNETSITSCKV
jgi:hypothetical protein